MDEHVRIELLDPKWREQKAAYEAKLRQTNLADTNSVSENLNRLTEFRSDIFGDGTVSLTRKVDDNINLAKLNQKAKVIWDGKAQSVVATATKLNRIAHQEAMKAAGELEQKQERESKRVKLDKNTVSKVTQMLIHIVLPSKEELDVPISKEATVSQLKEEISKSASIAVGKQKLLMQDKTVLKNSTPVSNFASGTTFHLEFKERGGKKN
jgi:hypothetical protein